MEQRDGWVGGWCGVGVMAGLKYNSSIRLLQQVALVKGYNITFTSKYSEIELF